MTNKPNTGAKLAAFDILLTGVGGQGTVLASRLLAEGAIAAGYFVRTSETIGMAQRGGCVSSHLRLESQGKAPFIPKSGGDLLLGFEPAETLRSLGYLKPEGKILTNTKAIKGVYNPQAPVYDPNLVLAHLQAQTNAIFVDAHSLALAAGSIKALNVVLLGAAFGANYLPFKADFVLEAMENILPAKLHKLNLTAFNLGLKSQQ